MKVKGKKAVAAHFGVSPRQITNWEKAGMPGRIGNEYDLVVIQVWRDRRQGRTTPSDERQGFLSPQRGKDFQEERLKRAKADLVEMEVRQRRGELVEWSRVEQLFVARIMAMKQGVLSLARALPPQLIRCQNEREMEIIIGRMIWDLLAAFSRPLPQASAPQAEITVQHPEHQGNGGSGG